MGGASCSGGCSGMEEAAGCSGSGRPCCRQPQPTAPKTSAAGPAHSCPTSQQSCATSSPPRWM